MKKFHVNDAGNPGECSAKVQCPFGGDAQHYPTKEIAQKAFELSNAASNVPKASKKNSAGDDASAVVKEPKVINKPSVVVDNRPPVERYIHPQGKIIEIDRNGSVNAWKDGKFISTSATAEKLRKGYGAWKRTDVDSTGDRPDMTAASRIARTRITKTDLSNLNKAAYPDTKATEKELFNNFGDSKTAVDAAVRAQKDLVYEMKIYDEANAISEGRAYRYDYSQGYDPIVVTSKDEGKYSVKRSDEQTEALKKSSENIRIAYEKLTDSQTEIEEAGLGHKIPDGETTIRVRTQAQKWLLKNELQGQITDGQWENSSGEAGMTWGKANVIVDPQNVGRNFYVRKDNFQLNAKSLIEIVGGRMIKDVKTRTSDDSYDGKKMNADLQDLRNIFKTKRDSI